MIRLRRRVYLDNNATTPIATRVAKKMEKVLRSVYGNPSSLYRTARDAAAVLEDSRTAVASAIGAGAHEILFTGSASEANNQILQTMEAIATEERCQIISSPIEHPSVMETLNYLRSRGMDIRYCSVDSEGRIVLKDLEDMIGPRTLLVSIMYANNETGIIQDIGRVAELARNHGALVMSDCVQALGKIPVDVRRLGLDYAVFSAHKIHGPKGIGALYAKEGSPLFTFVHGGHQERGLRAGTESTHNIAGLAEACREVPSMLASAESVRALRDGLVRGLREIKPDVKINCGLEDSLPNTVSITFPGFENAALMGFLDYHGIGVSAGSACNTQVNEPSHVLKAIGLTDEEARQTIRFSLSDRTTGRDIRYVLAIVSAYFSEDRLPVAMISPGQIDEGMLFREDTFIFDVRYWYDRKILKSLPNSHEGSAVFLGRYLHAVPRNKNIITICQTGFDGPVAAYYLRSKGYRKVGFVVGGLAGWRLAHPDLYERLAGQNVTKIMPKKRSR